MNINKRHLGYILLFLTSILFIYSVYYIYIKSNIETTISSKEIKAKLNNVETELNMKKIGKLEIKDISNIDYSINDIFDQNILMNPTNIETCNKFNNNMDKKNNCIYNYYVGKYSILMNTKGIIDFDLCNKIGNRFGADSGLYGRCIFIYAVNHGTKYKNINSCGILPTDKVLGPNNRNGYKSYESCVKLVTYAVFGRDSVLGKYMKVLQERGDTNKSAIGNQIINKYGSFIQGKAGGVEFTELSLKDYLELTIKNYKLTKN